LPDPRYRAVVADDEASGRDAVVTLLRDEPAVEVVGEAASPTTSTAGASRSSVTTASRPAGSSSATTAR
jgi:hypothetical protein